MFKNPSKILNHQAQYFRILLMFIAALFLLLHLFAAFAQQATPDEMSQVYLLQQYGLIGSYQHLSAYFNVRWVSLFVSNAFLFFMQSPEAYRIGAMLLYTALAALFVFSFRALLNELKVKCNDWFWIGIIFYTAFYFFTVASIELFGWVSGAATYLLPGTVFFFFIALWLKPSFNRSDFFQMMACALVLGGCAENFFVFALLFALFVMAFQKMQLRADSILLLKKFLAFIVFALLGFIPGKSLLGFENKVHVLKDLPDEFALKSHSVEEHFFISDFHFFEPRMLFALLLLLLCAWVLSPQLKVEKSVFKFSTVFIVAIGALNFFGAVVLFGNLGSGRFWSPVYFFTLLLIFLLLLHFLGKQRDDKNILSHARLATAAACALILLYYTIDHVPALVKYFRHTRELNAQIQTHQQKGTNQALYVKPYPVPEIIVENVITEDSTHFFNVSLMRYHQCHFPILRHAAKP